uniref:FAD-binding FR-type domain-containing protein n=1 Tax=Arundo donax TaxID=35708 RepID=A0A0A9D9G4_ARUDO
MRALPLLRRRVRPLTTAYAVRQDAAVWTPAPVSAVGAATADGSVFHVAVDLSDAAALADSYVAPGQYLQVQAGLHGRRLAPPARRRGSSSSSSPFRGPPRSGSAGSATGTWWSLGPSWGRGSLLRGSRRRTPRKPCSSSPPGRGSVQFVHLSSLVLLPMKELM